MRQLLLTFAFAVSVLAATDPFLGTWKPDLEKWKLSPGAPESRKQEVITLEAAGNNQYRETISRLDGASASGQPPIWIVDGKDHEGTDPEGRSGTSKLERINDRHLRRTVKSGKGTAVMDYVVSMDGQTLTLTRKGTGATSGRSLDETLVYTRQATTGK